MANLQLNEDLLNKEIDIAPINEPCVYQEKIVGFQRSYDSVYLENMDSLPRAAIMVNKRYKYRVKFVSRDVVSILVEVYGRNLEVISVYCPPFKDLEGKIGIMQGLLQLESNIPNIFMGDFNAKSVMWGPRSSDHRGNLLEDFLNEYDLVVINEPTSRPTYCSVLGESWIDLAFFKNIDIGEIHNWEILDEISASDHNLMAFILVFESDQISAPKKWKLKNLNWMVFQKKIFELTKNNPVEEVAPKEIGDYVRKMEEKI